MKKLVASRWFAIADLAAVSTSIIVWELNPGLGWQPLLIALAPWFLRILAGKAPFKRTKFDFLLFVFLLTAAMGVWAAYDRDTAWLKFWLLIAAVLMFYTYAGQPRSNLWPLAGYLGLIGFGLSVYFLLTHDWSVQFGKIGILSQIGLAWMKIRPNVGTSSMHPNDAAGIMAMMLPFLTAHMARAWKLKKRILFSLLALATLVVLAGITLSASRGAWMAVFTAIGVGFLWIVSGYLRSVVRQPRVVIFAVTLVGLGILGLGIVLANPERIIDLAGTIPGPNSAISRVELANAAVKLIEDFPFTGGGLQSFPGLYSQYILVIPNFITGISHNIFLDLALEQGIIGLLSYIVILAGSVWILAKADLDPSEYPLRWAVIAATIVMAVHGLVDDIVYNVWGAPELLLLSGFAVGLTHSGKLPAPDKSRNSNDQRMSIALTTAFILTLTLGFVFRNQILASWYANLGAVIMSRVELAKFPTNSWDDGSQIKMFSPAEDVFQTALRYDPQNRTANHRMGLIDMLKRNYDQAIVQLEAANQMDPGHPGIRKSLGYSYVWAGKIDQATPLLKTIPETQNEMSSYAYWWQSMGRNDLSTYAFEIIAQLAAQKNP